MRAILLLAVAASSQAQTVLVSSFENDEELRLLSPRGTRISVVSSGATHGAKALRIDYDNVQWPAMWFQPPAPWDLSSFGDIAFDVTNPLSEPVVFRIRVDDDPRADGTRYCRSGSVSVPPGETRTLAFPLQTASSVQLGMKGAPPSPDSTSTGSNGSWTLNLSNIVAFQFFMSSPGPGKYVYVDHVRFRPRPAFDGIVDRYGQYSRADWPGKLQSDADFARTLEAEREDIEKHPVPAGRDRFGGWAAGPRLEAAGFFRTAKVNGKWWLVTPDGTLFFSVGQDGIRLAEYTFIAGREQMFQWLPEEGDPLRKYVGRQSGDINGGAGLAINWYGLNIERKYGPAFFEPWAADNLARSRSWGFNTIGNWSDSRLFGRDTPYVVPGGISGTHNRIRTDSPRAGATIHDPWDPRFAVNVRNSLRAQADQVRGDPFCLGWFVDNELDWGNRDTDRNRYAVATGTLAQNAGTPAKQAFIGLLQERYGGSLAGLNAAWETEFARWEDLAAPAALNDRIRADYSAFVKEHARLYFRTVREVLRSLDPDHLYLGARFMSAHTVEAVEACAEYCDVMSFNIYQRQVVPSSWSHVERLDKPALIGEFHFGALDRGMFHTGLQAAANQAERAELYKQYVRSVLDHPSFVGCHWFRAGDQPLTGRVLDGENYNIGFVTITDTPYPEMVEAAREVHAEIYTRRSQ